MTPTAHGNTLKSIASSFVQSWPTNVRSTLLSLILQMLTIVICVTDNNFPNLLLAACTLLILKV